MAAHGRPSSGKIASPLRDCINPGGSRLARGREVFSNPVPKGNRELASVEAP